MTINFSTHGHHLITAAGFLLACALQRQPWKYADAKDITANVSCIALSTLAIAGVQKLGAAFIRSPSAIGIAGRGAVHVVGGILAAAAIDEMIMALRRKF